MEVKVTEPADFFLLRINRCWATQMPHPNATEGSQHTLLQNGSERFSLWGSLLSHSPSKRLSFSRCAHDHTVSFILNGTGQSGLNGESSTVRYSFDMFRFTTEPLQLYLHCSVQLCAPDDPESCKPVSSIYFKWMTS